MVVEADYLLVGAGAMGLAFADALLAESDATIAIVDAHAAPGGHWNDAYGFVRLHQPSSSYGVSSMPLGREDQKDETGINTGLYPCATGDEVRRYFAEVMERLLATGRVHYFPSSRWIEGGRFVSSSGDEGEVTIRKALVDGTYTQTEVPSTHPPAYRVADGARCVPVNGLPLGVREADAFVIVGAGKTAMDACVWLLEQGVAPEDIRWIRARDPWVVDRKRLQPFDLARHTLEGLALSMEAAAAAENVGDLFSRLSASRQLLRIDEDVTPAAYRCAIVSEAELAHLRRIKDVVRLGRVLRIDEDRIVLEQGTVPTRKKTLHVDCTAQGIKRRPEVPVFGDRTITLQPVRVCQPSFSAALVGFVEATIADAATKNAVCAPIPYGNDAIDWVRMTLAGTMNEHLRSKNDAVRKWTERTRLNMYRDSSDKTRFDAEMKGFGARFAQSVGPALGNLRRLLPA